ncbi:MAG TPA: Crp/Fnr family transcriptional regulator [Agriterribacter sp.]|nr:Crp/Fnr family transcriptional regulator [Agriterribacter sp.]
MNVAILLKGIATHISLTADEEAGFVAFLKDRKIKKKHFLYQEGDINTHIAFVVEGCLRSYSIDRNGFEHVLQFAPPGWWIGDMRSIVTRKPGTLYIDAVDDSEILLLRKADLDKVYAFIPPFERYFRIITEKAMIAYQHRLIGNMSLPAKERYESFCRLYPGLIQCLPQKQIAAYIGVTPEFLSKMLNQPAGGR